MVGDFKRGLRFSTITQETLRPTDIQAMNNTHKMRNTLSPCSSVGALGAAGAGEMIMFLRLDRVDDRIPPPPPDAGLASRSNREQHAGR